MASQIPTTAEMQNLYAMHSFVRPSAPQIHPHDSTKTRNLFGLPGAFIEDLNRLAPRRSLAIVDLSKIQHLPLNHATIMNAPVLHNRPCPMSLAVLVANLGAQKHDADSRAARGRARSLVGTTGVCANLGPAKSSACRDQTPRKS